MADSNMKSLKSILKNFDWDEKKYISREFQDYGCRLAEILKDDKHKSLYIKLAKQTPRHLLEETLSFVKNAQNVKNPARLFMWKLTQLKKEKEKKKEK